MLQPVHSFVGERVDAIQAIMRVFGSTTSVIHDNATRYTSLTSLEFDTAGLLVGGNVQVRGPDLFLVSARCTSVNACGTSLCGCMCLS